MFRVRNAAGEWRHLEAHLTDLHADRHLRGVLVNARDVTERERLEAEVALQAARDTFGGQLVEALEMADEEAAAFDVVERAMVEISRGAPMELLLSDSSRAHLERAASEPATCCPRRLRAASGGHSLAGAAVLPGGGSWVGCLVTTTVTGGRHHPSGPYGEPGPAPLPGVAASRVARERPSHLPPDAGMRGLPAWVGTHWAAE